MEASSWGIPRGTKERERSLPPRAISGESPVLDAAKDSGGRVKKETVKHTNTKLAIDF
jgi:hypothetical protein